LKRLVRISIVPRQLISEASLCMAWHGQERRSGNQRRVVERRRTMRYNVSTLLIIDGITWVDPEGGERRRDMRRRADREALAIKFAHRAHP
ncbi:MAG: hypothetical protein WAV20_18685, partial [Blastocatellia bacterium]